MVNAIETQKSGGFGHEFWNILVMMEPCGTGTLGFGLAILSDSFGSSLVQLFVIGWILGHGDVAVTLVVGEKVINRQYHGVHM